LLALVCARSVAGPLGGTTTVAAVNKPIGSQLEVPDKIETSPFGNMASNINVKKKATQQKKSTSLTEEER
jgi:hypothetical protein